MTNYSLTDDELETLARFGSLDQPSDVDPQHFAKLLSLALLEQKEGGPAITELGRDPLAGRSGRKQN